jgi:hypothetical protein
MGSQDGVVGIVTGYGLDDRGIGVRVPVGSRILYSPRPPDRIWSPPDLLSNGCGGGSFPGRVKRSGRETDHSPPTTAEVKKMLTYTSTPPYVFMAGPCCVLNTVPGVAILVIESSGVLIMMT